MCWVEGGESGKYAHVSKPTGFLQVPAVLGTLKAHLERILHSHLSSDLGAKCRFLPFRVSDLASACEIYISANNWLNDFHHNRTEV